MANRRFNQFPKTLEKEIVKLYGSFTLGSSGAVASSSGLGIASIVKNTAAGNYTVTLSDPYYAFKTALVRLDSGSGTTYTAADGYIPIVKSVSVSGATSFQVQFLSADGLLVAANPTSGFVVRLEVTVKNSATIP